MRRWDEEGGDDAAATEESDGMKGIVLAGGSGSRLSPSTGAVSKHLLPIYDKPMVYYPLSTLMLAGIRDVAIISTVRDLPSFKRLLGDGRQLGMWFQYLVQEEPRGIADAFLVAEEWLAGERVALILGDNVFYGLGFSDLLAEGASSTTGATIYGYPVRDPADFGVVDVGSDGRPLSIEEKPDRPRSNLAVPGLYFYDNDVIHISRSIKTSPRGELEITDVNRAYLARGDLSVILMGRGMAWLDTGTPEGLLLAGQFVEAIQNRQGMYVACIEEIAWRKGFIEQEQLAVLGKALLPSAYGQYVMQLAQEGR